MKNPEVIQLVDQKKQQTPLSVAKRNYILGLLTAIFALSFVERGLLGVVLDPVKKEFALSDTMMGLMVGFGFAFLNCGVGLVVSRFVDRKFPRVPIIALGISFASLMTALSGLVVSGWQMFSARMGVGLGQAGMTTASQSTISDIFPREKRPFALSVFQMGPLIGVYLGFMMGGLITYYHGWRAAFVCAGIPGILLGLLLYFTTKEPPRGLSDGAGVDTKVYGLGRTLRYLFTSRTFVWATLGSLLASYTNFSVSAWLAPFLLRVHHLNQAQVGVWGGSAKGLAGIAGVLIGGYVVQRISRRNDKLKTLVPGIALFISGPLFLIFLLPNSLSLAMFGFALAVFFSSTYNGPLMAVILGVVKVRMRTLGAAAYQVPGALIAYGFAPLIVGMLNDILKPRYGVASVRYSLITAAVAAMLAGVCFMIASRFVNQDVKKALEEEIG